MHYYAFLLNIDGLLSPLVVVAPTLTEATSRAKAWAKRKHSFTCCDVLHVATFDTAPLEGTTI